MSSSVLVEQVSNRERDDDYTTIAMEKELVMAGEQNRVTE